MAWKNIGLLALVSLGVVAAMGASKGDEPKDKPGDDPKKPEDKPDKPADKPADKPTDLVIDQAAEAAACEWATKLRPLAYDGLERAPDQSLVVWLAIVAWRRAYPASPKQPGTVAELAAFSRLTSCVAKAIEAADKPGPDKPAPDKPGPDKPPADDPAWKPDDPRNADAPTTAEMTTSSAVVSEAKADPSAASYYSNAPDAPAPLPADGYRKRLDRGKADWFANRVYWYLYADPKTSVWIQKGGSPAPWRAANDPAWAAVWTRIRKYLGDVLKVPNTTPKEEPAEGGWKPDDPRGAAAPTTAEMTTSSTLVQAANANPAGASVYANAPDAPPPLPPDGYRKRLDRGKADWFANCIYWYLYADPKTSVWIQKGGSPAPWKASNDPKWAAVWTRIRKYLGDVLKVPNTPPAQEGNADNADPEWKPDDPRGAVPLDVATTAERTQAKLVADYAKANPNAAATNTYPGAPDAPPPLKPDGYRLRGTRTMANWLTNYVYWYLYADPTKSVWIKSGGSPAPWASSGAWNPVWSRIKKYLVNDLKVSDV